MSKRCEHCGHLMSKHPKPKHLKGWDEWDFYKNTCCVKNCRCNISCFGQLLDKYGNIIKKYDVNHAVRETGGKK